MFADAINIVVGIGVNFTISYTTLGTGLGSRTGRITPGMCTTAFRNNFDNKHRVIIVLLLSHQKKNLTICATENVEICVYLSDYGITHILILQFLSCDNKLTGFRSAKCNIVISFYIFHTCYIAGITQYDFQIRNRRNAEIVHLRIKLSHFTDINSDTIAVRRHGAHWEHSQHHYERKK